VGFPVPYELTGRSPAARSCAAEAERCAALDRHVLVVAERGLDAEGVARMLHARSGRRCSAPFVPVPADGSAAQTERELFGAAPREAAADVQCVSPASALMRANGGVLFLPQIDDLSSPLQRRLARLLRDGEAQLPRRGSPVPVDVRVIASTEVPEDGTVRDDLLRRFPLVLRIPPLRERRDDVPEIADAMLASYGRGHHLTPAARVVLSALPWRRNTAELDALMRRLTAGRGPAIRQEDVLSEIQLDRTPVHSARSFRDARRQFERDYIGSVLRAHDWQMRDAARALGMERANLYRKARQLGIPLRREPQPRQEG
jgi:DNA-binding NtrC family response regulator